MSDKSGSVDDSSNSEETWVFYRDRPEWKDVQGLPQNEGPSQVAKITYSEKFEDVYDYFRAIMVSGEVSERVLALTKDALELNPANYSVWHHRRHLLKELKSDLNAEMAYCRSMTEVNPKNYQVWQHRRALVEWTKDPSQELRFTEIILNEDSKNYHAWQHRQWAIHTYSLFQDELDFVYQLLCADMRNNSAWNQRFFVITSSKNEGLKSRGGGCLELSNPLLKEEVDFTLKAVAAIKSNESAWNYLRGLIDHAEESLAADLKQRVTSICEKMLAASDEYDKKSPYLMAMLVDLYREQSEAGNGDGGEKTLELLHDLANNYDVIRKEYWEFVAEDVRVANILRD